MISSFEPLVIPFWFAHLDSTSNAGTIKAPGNFLFSPKTMTCPINVDSMSLFSMDWGAIYFPPAVLNISFFRSVIFRKPSDVISPISPVLKKPLSSKASFVASSFL
ncbi:hypothetical protein D3C73_867070 [compost metagenome]